MCVIVQYLCPKCKKETGQRDYLCHTDGQRFAIPDPKSKSIDSPSYCCSTVADFVVTTNV